MLGSARSTWLAGLLSAVLAAAPAAASDKVQTAEEAALAAAAVLDAECLDMAGGGATDSAEALVAVGPVLAEVSRTYDATRALSLLYWRGLLGSCVGQEQRAVQDLGAFVGAAADLPEYADQVRDSLRRLQRLTKKQAARKTLPASSAAQPRGAAGPVLLVSGVATLAAGVGVTIGSYDRGNTLYPSLETTAGWNENIDAYREARTGERVGIAIVGVGTAVLTAGLITLAVDKAKRAKTKRSKR